MSSNDKNRMTAYSFDANDLIIIGGAAMPEGGGPNDTADTDGPGYDARILRPLEESDVLNVLDLGIIQPVVLRKDGPRNIVQAGRQRVRWAREAAKRLGTPVKVPCVFRTGTDMDHLKVMISENQHRTEDDFENMAKKCQTLMKYGATEQEAAITMRVTTAAIRNWMKYFDLAPEVQEAMKKGAITGSAAVQLADLPRAEQRDTLDDLVDEATALGHKVVKVENAKAAKRKRTTGNKEASTRPGLRLMTKVVSHVESENLPDGFLLGVRWAMGDIAPEKVKGLKAILRDVAGGGGEAKGKGGKVLFSADDE